MAAVGSTCTIVAEYLRAFDVEFSSESKSDTMIATGMMLGLMVDTDNLLGESVDRVRDINAFLYLKERYDPALYARIMRYDYPTYFYECFSTSYNNKIIAEPLGIYSLGFLKEERAGAISQIADLWMRRERLHIVVVFAFVGKELVASIRTKNGGNRASEIAKILFPDSGAGGGKTAAGATVVLNQFIDPDLLVDEQSKQELLHITMSILVARAKRSMDLDE
jgi:nanoRNase/pAp phosphatase (c-di-AMP/oligoRNAs hydrolase)